MKFRLNATEIARALGEYVLKRKGLSFGSTSVHLQYDVQTGAFAAEVDLLDDEKPLKAVDEG